MSKTRHGARVIKRYDQATTPLDRVLGQFGDMVDPDELTTLQTLQHDNDIETLKHRITDIQANLLELARRRGQLQRRARTNHVYLSRRKLTPPTRASSDESTNQTTRHLDVSQQDSH